MEFEVSEGGEYVLVPKGVFAVMLDALEQQSKMFKEAVESPTESEQMKLMCEHPGSKKIMLIKTVRGITKWALKEAKDWSEGKPTYDLLGAALDLEKIALSLVAVSPGSVFNIVPAVVPPPPTVKTIGQKETTNATEEGFAHLGTE